MPSHHPQSPRTKGERRRRAKATSESNKSLQERRRRSTSTPTQPQTSTTPRRASRGPTKVDYVFRWRFTSFTSKGPRHQGAVWRLRLSNKEQGAYLKLISFVGANTNSLPVRKRSSSSSVSERLSPSGCSPLLHFQEPTTIPSRPTKVKRTATRHAPHRTRASALAKAGKQPRQTERTPTPGIAREALALPLGLNRWQCFGRDFLAPGSIGDLSEHTGKPCLGAQVDTPTHRCDSHVRRRPALVSAPSWLG